MGLFRRSNEPCNRDARRIDLEAPVRSGIEQHAHPWALPQIAVHRQPQWLGRLARHGQVHKARRRFAQISWQCRHPGVGAGRLREDQRHLTYEGGPGVWG